VLRKWYAVIAVFAATASLFYHLSSEGGTYSTRTVVDFQLAGTSDLDRYNGFTDKSVISFASAVATRVNNGRAPQGYGLSDAPLYGAGIRQGTVISLPNEGNQWISMYRDAEIEIQVVGRSAEWTRATQQLLVRKVIDTARQLQGPSSSIDPEARISFAAVPVTAQIDYIAASRSSRIAAASGLFIAASITSVWLAVSLDRLRLRRLGPARNAAARTAEPTLEVSNA